MNIKLQDVHKSYKLGNDVEIKALRGVNLEVKAGESVAVIGPSGAGKSTLLHILGLMDRPTSGSVVFDSEDLAALGESERADLRKNKIGFIFQLHYLLPEFNVLENVLIPVWEDKEKEGQRISGILSQLGLSSRINNLPSELSGGEQQRVALVRALVNNPQVLLADEPTGDLDRETGEVVENIIFDECRKRKVTLVLVTHNQELAKKADRIVKMRDGLITDG